MPGSPPTRGRGSKPGDRGGGQKIAAGRPLRGGVDRNIDRSADGSSREMSPPTRGRGSKLAFEASSALSATSPPTRGRGSKPRYVSEIAGKPIVAPYAGAWIETNTSPPGFGRNPGRPLRGGVDRNSTRETRQTLVPKSPPTRGRGSKHASPCPSPCSEWSPPTRGRGSKPPDWSRRICP